MTNVQSLTKLNKQEYEQHWEKWHEKREDAIKTPYGWLSLRSIDWLEDGKKNKIDGFPGLWGQSGNAVTYYPEEGKTVTNRDQIISEPKVIVVDNVEDVNVEDFYYEGVRAQLIKRIGSTKKFAVRQRDPESKFRKNFTGFPHFEPDENWVLPARYEPLDHWSNITTKAVTAGLSHNETQIGNLYFKYRDKAYRFVVFQGHNDDSGWLKKDPETGETRYLNNRQNTDGIGFILFKDQSTGKQTYGGGRVLSIDISNPNEVDSVDLNKAFNLPCAYSYFCTCPFAPEENILPFAVTSGEKTPDVY